MKGSVSCLKPERNRTRDIGFFVLLAVILIAVIFTMTEKTESNRIEKYSDLKQSEDANVAQEAKNALADIKWSASTLEK